MQYDGTASFLSRLGITHRLCITADKINDKYPDGV